MNIALEDFVDAMNHTFKTLADRDLDIGPIEPFDGTPIFADISARLPLKLDGALELNGGGAVVLTVSEKAAADLVEAISGAPAVEQSLMAEAVGEILNMIVGATQRRSRTPFEYDLPSVQTGKAHEVTALRDYSERVVSRIGDENIGLYLVKNV